ncbi:MAG: hypothetical protein HYY96_08530 [Candidatus Tectomicrobia bacterium]|nr:hypothetical protein [Candidatus Tectomicrobia bacterium]
MNGKKLTITVDLDGNYGPSSTGKPIIVATTSGFVKVPGHEDISFSINVNKKK